MSLKRPSLKDLAKWLNRIYDCGDGHRIRYNVKVAADHVTRHANEQEEWAKRINACWMELYSGDPQYDPTDIGSIEDELAELEAVIRLNKKGKL